MEVQLTSTWTLTTDHTASNEGKAMLVNSVTGKEYGPDDILQAYPSWDYHSAREVFRSLAEVVALTTKERADVAMFIRLPSAF